MKTTFLSVVTWGLAVAPAFAGDGGAMDGAGALLIQALGRLVGKLSGMF
jgi:hypothetical protein